MFGGFFQCVFMPRVVAESAMVVMSVMMMNSTVHNGAVQPSATKEPRERAVSMSQIREPPGGFAPTQHSFMFYIAVASV